MNIYNDTKLQNIDPTIQIYKIYQNYIPPLFVLSPTTASSMVIGDNSNGGSKRPGRLAARDQGQPVGTASSGGRGHLGQHRHPNSRVGCRHRQGQSQEQPVGGGFGQRPGPCRGNKSPQRADAAVHQAEFGQPVAVGFEQRQGNLCQSQRPYIRF